MASNIKRSAKLQEFVAHGTSVNCLALGHKSGRVMVTGGEDKKVNLWAVGKPNCILSLKGHSTSVECVKFGRIEEIMCAGSSSGALKIWDLEAIKILKTLTGHKLSVKCIDFHPYGECLASGSLDTSIKLWDTRRNGCIYTYKGHCKTVNTLKFSPDGKWIASGGEDGIVRIWDLQAGKLLAEFGDHIGAICDVKFHPNEFLLASGSTDRAVKFWDLEKFQLLSSSDGSTGQVRCIQFSPEGECLFSASHDSLKVFGWEPSCTYDFVLTNWNRIADMSISQNQLIAGSFSTVNVSIHVVDLTHVRPFAKSSGNSSPEINFSFNKEHHIEVKVDKEQLTTDINGDFENDNIAYRVVIPQSCYNGPQSKMYQDYFVPKSELARTPPRNTSFPEPFSEPKDVEEFSLAKEFQDDKTCENLQYTARQSSDLKVSSSLNIEHDVPNLPVLGSFSETSSLGLYRNPGESNSTIVKEQDQTNLALPISSLPIVPLENTSNMRWKTNFVPETTSVLKPIPIIPENIFHAQRTSTFPEELLTNLNDLGCALQSREKPQGLDVKEFLPKHIQDSIQIGVRIQPHMSEAEAICCISRDHEALMRILSHRKKNLLNILQLWKSQNVKCSVEYAANGNDHSTLVDVLSIITMRPKLWTLDICQILLPCIYELIRSKYEEYRAVACNAVKLILENFLTVIKSNIVALPGIGVDLSRDERYKKCTNCYQQLILIQEFVSNCETLHGRPGELFQELQILLKNVE